MTGLKSQCSRRVDARRNVVPGCFAVPVEDIKRKWEKFPKSYLGGKKWEKMECQEKSLNSWVEQVDDKIDSDPLKLVAMSYWEQNQTVLEILLHSSASSSKRKDESIF